MPIYEFRNCNNVIIEELWSVQECPDEIMRTIDGKVIEVTGSVTDAIKKQNVFKKILSGSSFRLKGEGFHANDYAEQ